MQPETKTRGNVCGKIGLRMCSNYIKPPSNPLRDVFTDEVIQEWVERRNPSDFLKSRIASITTPLSNSDKRLAEYEITRYRIRREAWNIYLYAAFACGLFEGDDEEDLRARLRSPDDQDFRGAMAECMVCWILSGKYKLNLSPRPQGRGNRVLEFLAKTSFGEINIEVKAPYRERLQSWCGDDSDILKRCIDKANSQFAEDRINMLVIVPELRLITVSRFDLVKAFYGQSYISIPIDTRTGGPAGPEEIEFRADGRFLNLIRSGIKPGFTRTSAVMCVEEEIIEKGSRKEIAHNIYILHNPHTKYSIPYEYWSDCKQVIIDGDVLKWDDDHPMTH